MSRLGRGEGGQLHPIAAVPLLKSSLPSPLPIRFDPTPPQHVGRCFSPDARAPPSPFLLFLLSPVFLHLLLIAGKILPEDVAGAEESGEDDTGSDESEDEEDKKKKKKEKKVIRTTMCLTVMNKRKLTGDLFC